MVLFLYLSHHLFDTQFKLISMTQWKKYLSSLGFTDSEIAVYLTSLKEGPLSVQDLARKTGVSRVTVYHVIESLTNQGLMTSVEKGAKQQYTAEPPERVVSLGESRLQKMKQTVGEMQERIQELKLIQTGSRPVVKLFEGDDAVRAMFADFLASGSKEIREFGNFDATDSVVDPSVYKPFYDQLNKRRVKRKLLFLTKNSDPKVASDLEEIRLLPRHLDFNGDIFLYGNKVVLSSTEGKHIAVIIESESIAKTVATAFDLLWDQQGKKK